MNYIMLPQSSHTPKQRKKHAVPDQRWSLPKAIGLQAGWELPALLPGTTSKQVMVGWQRTLFAEIAVKTQA